MMLSRGSTETADSLPDGGHGRFLVATVCAVASDAVSRAKVSGAVERVIHPIFEFCSRAREVGL